VFERRARFVGQVIIGSEGKNLSLLPAGGRVNRRCYCCVAAAAAAAAAAVVSNRRDLMASESWRQSVPRQPRNTQQHSCGALLSGNADAVSHSELTP